MATVDQTPKDGSILMYTDIPDLEFVARGKVRDIYKMKTRPGCLLFIATDRISAYDVILNNVNERI